MQDLKKELKLRGLSSTGNKNELAERLQNALNKSEIITSESVDDLEEDLLNVIIVNVDNFHQEII